MERKKRAQFGIALLVWMLIGATFILPTSAEKTGDSWIDSFDQWVEPRDMSMYTKDIVIEDPNCTISQEEVKRTPGLMVIDKDADMSLCKHEMKIDYSSNYTADIIVTDASAGDVDATKENYSVAMTNGTATWYRIHATFLLFSPGKEGPQISAETIPPEDIPTFVAEAERNIASNFTGAVAGDAIMVTSLDHTIREFYLIPFYQDGNPVAVAYVSITENGTPHYRGIYDFPDPAAALTFLPLTEVRQALGNAGDTEGNWTARVVSMFCDEPIGPYFWECEEEGGEKVYVGYDPYDDVVRVYAEVTPKSKAG